ncbi:rhomboid family intramembrane serine protease [Mucilaginibacter sp. HMF7410]|uniref:Rhomboid family intramembrane serine protease n=2 Tax=Mucilaginibacter arboris TaxID=2682090 RepID=A0A7K1SWI6_9SPHI|nr:rhomboid family intramembrane serine protease [Mucilaginibacter arboris]
MIFMWEEIRTQVFRSGNRLNLLIGINVLVFLFLSLLGVIEMLTTRNAAITLTLNDFLAVPSYLPKLLIRFWTPLTYMFLHDGFFHILFNMLWFYWLGSIFQEYLGGKKLVDLYIIGGLAGAFLYVSFYNIFPLFAEAKFGSTTVGASAAVMAIIVATATLLPDYTIQLLFLGSVKLKWIALFYVLFDLISITGPNAGGEISHIGGAIAGFFYIKHIQGSSMLGQAFQRFSKPKTLHIVSKNYAKNSTVRSKEEEIDSILDKISQSGYASLTKKEKETLFNASKE